MNDQDYFYKSQIPLSIELEELKQWILYEDERLLVINKPGWVVCHPSKNGPLSSLVGACRLYTNLEKLHLVSRLDRETSGIVIFAKDRGLARICQMAFENRLVAKTYYAILNGTFTEPTHVDQPLAKDRQSQVFVKQTVRKDRTAQNAQTFFSPLLSANGYTFTQIEPLTGRKHQIRAHAQWLGFPIVGDKIYGSNDTLYLEFIEKGWTPRLENELKFRRQALHAGKLVFKTTEFEREFNAPIPPDMCAFCSQFMHLASLQGSLKDILGVHEKRLDVLPHASKADTSKEIQK